MKPDIQAILETIASQVDIDSLYLCGPFDRRGVPSSPDIHVLALSKDDDLRDLHYVPGVAHVAKRVEVRVIPVSRIKHFLSKGIKNLSEFHTLDKILRGRPIIESREVRESRKSLAAGIKIKPSFYARLIQPLTARPAGGLQSPVGALDVLGANHTLLSTLAVYCIAGLGKTYSRHSDLLIETRKMWLCQSPGKALTDRIMQNSRRVVEVVSSRSGLNVKAVARHHMRYPPQEEAG